MEWKSDQQKWTQILCKLCAVATSVLTKSLRFLRLQNDPLKSFSFRYGHRHFHRCHRRHRPRQALKSLIDAISPNSSGTFQPEKIYTTKHLFHTIKKYFPDENDYLDDRKSTLIYLYSTLICLDSSYKSMYYEGKSRLIWGYGGCHLQAWLQ